MRTSRLFGLILSLIASPQIATVDVAAAAPEALLVIGTVSVPNINPSDAAIRTRLEIMGFTVTVLADAASTTDDATGKALVVVSSTITSGNVAAKFLDVTVPVVNWEQAVQDDFMMTGNEGTDHATLGGLTDMEFVNSTHPLAAGLNGVVPIVKSTDTFSWGLPVDTAIKIAQVPGDPTKFPLYGYEKGALMFGDYPAPERRVMLPFGDTSFEMLTDNGLKLFDAAIIWAANNPNIKLPPAITATVRITGPVEGATFSAGGNIPITVNATDPIGPIQKVEFFADSNKIGEAPAAPFSFTWTNVAAGRYSLTAKATDRLGQLVPSAAVNIVVGAPKPEVLLVIGTVSVPNINTSDDGIRARLESMGYTVKVLADTPSTTADAANKALVIVSSTITSGNVGTKFRTVPVPVINWEQAVQDDFGMTGNAGTDHATLAGQTDLEIVDSAHPLAAGLKGVVTIVSDIDVWSWGLPVSGAIVIAQVPGDPAMVPLYAYEAGAPMFNGFKAPARRVMLPFGDTTFANLNEDGLKLFDAAIKWAAAPSTNVPPKFNAPVRQGNNLTLSWTGAGRLQQADTVAGPWTDASSQTNPQTVAVAGPAKFYRIRQ